MDSLIVDLDKVLDDFEAEEDLAPGNETKPSGFQEYLEQANKQTWSTIENNEIYNEYDSKRYNEGNSQEVPVGDLSSVRYDFPYEPETFDLSEADFAPSASVGDSGYNGSLSYTDNVELPSESKRNCVSQSTKDQSHSGFHMNGDLSVKDNAEFNSKFPRQSDVLKIVSQSKKSVPQAVVSQSAVSQSQRHETQTELPRDSPMSGAVKLPVQADISPGQLQFPKMAFLTNGHSNTSLESDQNAKLVLNSQLSSIPSLDSINSNPEYNKYPVQCNTPQTPKENPLANPLVGQIRNNSHGIDQEKLSLSSQHPQSANDQTMQDNLKLQNLKEELEVNGDIGNENEHFKVAGKFTRSLPAYFHSQTVVQNGLNPSNSLPPDLKNEMQSASKETQMLSSGKIEQKSWEIYVSEALGLNKTSCVSQNVQHTKNSEEQNKLETDLQYVNSNKKETVGGGLIPTNESKTVVGFGNIEEDMDEADLDAYLGENVGNTKQCKDPGEDFLKDLQKNKFETEVSKICSVDDKNICVNNKSDANRTKLPKIENIERIKNENMKVKSQNSWPDKPLKCDLDVESYTENEIRHDESDNSVAPVLSGDQTMNQMENLDLEIFKVLPTDTSQMTAISNPVISDLSSTLSPVTNVSLDSGCASMSDNFEETIAATSEKITAAGARPKDLQSKVNRPSSLRGLSKVNLNAESPFVIKHSDTLSEMEGSGKKLETMGGRIVAKGPVTEARQLMEADTNADTRSSDETNIETYDDTKNKEETLVELRHPERLQQLDSPGTGRPRSWSPSDSGQPRVQKQKRPTSLNLPPQPTINPNVDHQLSEEDQSPLAGADVGDGNGNDVVGASEGLDSALGAEGGEDIPYIPPDTSLDLGPPPSYSSTLGQVAPKWIPDAEAPICMSCEARFTFTKRRHHCRACGKVFCSTCCSMKNRLPYLKNQEARVCVLCHSELALAGRDASNYPHPNNPSDYCSVVPPTQAAGNAASQPPPSVLVPVLKRDGHGGSEGTNRNTAPKQVMFSDGIRPGGDLTELDGSSEISRVPPRRSRVQKRVERVSQGQHSPRSRRLRTVTERTTKCLIPDVGLPPLAVPNDAQGNVLQPNPSASDFMADVKDEMKDPVIFAVNTNLHVSVKIVTLDCCVNRTVWCFTTKGMTSVGQEEIIIILECLPDEDAPPRDMFIHLNNVYEDASRGSVITELGHSIFNQSFLDSRDHGGFLYIRASFQCTQKLTLPSPPYLFGILLQKWETPWAKVFPLRLLLRLGAEYRYYPCPLIGIRNRKPVFFEIGHTIMNLLADFRNYQYMLPYIRGITIHMEDKVTKINFPRNRYEDLMKVVNNSNEHVMAIAATFSAEADSHLVCIQNDDGNYQTQAINIQNKPRKVTGASFVVFNGALKTSSGLSAKSSIVEDGLMVQITPDSMLALKQAIRDMHDYPITCGVIGAMKPDETVVVQWVEDDKNVNIGVKSPVDGMCMDGVESLRIHHATDYIGERNIVRWTEIFFIKNEERGSPKWDPVDLSRIGETVATACCMALTQHLEKLKEADLDRIGLRITLGADNVGYEAGAKGERLPDVYMNDLDNELIPVIHRATQPDTNIILELIFEVLE